MPVKKSKDLEKLIDAQARGKAAKGAGSGKKISRSRELDVRVSKKKDDGGSGF